MIPLYVRRGYRVEVECTPDKAILFEAAGAVTTPGGATHEHPWGYPAGGTHAGHGRFWQGSKIANNLSAHPLPNIGTADELWDELCASTIDILPRLDKQAIERVERWLARLPRPVVLLHTKGNTGQERKSLPDPLAAEFYKSLLDRFDGSLVLLDWDNRVPRLASYRVRHLDELGACPADVMLALMTQADLLIGVDSGPLHACRFTQTPSVGIWMPGHYPATYTLPRRQQLNIVLADHTRQWNRFKRIPWNIVEHPGSVFQPDVLADYCVRMLQPPRYLSGAINPVAELARVQTSVAEFLRIQNGATNLNSGESSYCKYQIAADIQLQQFIRDWCRGTTGNALSGFADRHRSFDVLFRELSRRFERPTIVETGTIRAEEDWGGAGFFTYLAGAYLARCGGKLHSVDFSPEHCDFARNWTAVFGDSVTIDAQDSLQFLGAFQEPIDLLYLDSLDTTEPGHADHAQRELAAARPRLHDRSLIVVDDTPWHAGAWVGKGARVVPDLLQEGWKVLYAGYQVVLGKESP